MAVDTAAGNDTEGTGGDAGRAAVTDVRLDENVFELGMDDRARRACLLARRRYTVFADVAHHQPTPSLGSLSNESNENSASDGSKPLEANRNGEFSGGNCSINLTCRQDAADSVSVLS